MQISYEGTLTEINKSLEVEEGELVRAETATLELTPNHGEDCALGLALGNLRLPKWLDLGQNIRITVELVTD